MNLFSTSPCSHSNPLWLTSNSCSISSPHKNIPPPYLIFPHYDKSHTAGMVGLCASHLQHKDTCFSLIVGSPFLAGFISGLWMSFEVRTKHLRTIVWIIFFLSRIHREEALEEKQIPQSNLTQCKWKSTVKSMKSLLLRSIAKIEHFILFYYSRPSITRLI